MHILNYCTEIIQVREQADYLIAKSKEAKAAGLDLREGEKATLLSLLLRERLLGTMTPGYEVTT